MDRCYLRGLSLLGIFNTIIGCLFNRVLVVAQDIETGRVVRWWDLATNWPAVEEDSARVKEAEDNE